MLVTHWLAAIVASLLATILGSSPARAFEMRSSLSAGVSAARVQGSAGSGSVDAPAVQLTLEHPLDARASLAVEIVRSANPGSPRSGAGFAGLAGRWYFWAPIPMEPRGDSTGRGSVVFTGSCPYAGLGLGYAGGASGEASGSGLGASVKLGIDFTAFRASGFRLESSLVATPPGESGLLAATLLAGLYWQW